MEGEMEGRVKSLPYKLRTVSRESASQKAAYVLDPDLRTHWSSSTNTKEWLVLELEESCLLSHIRIHNKSVLEWEISIGLRFKPETYLKVRPRCEAPRRDVTYPAGYQPCCYVRVSCLRGNPIAIFHIQLMGIPVPGLEPELQPVVEHVLPHIIAHVRDPHDIYLQLLQEIASRLSLFLPQLEGELAAGADAMESSLRFLAMLVGPFNPILAVLGGRETDKPATPGPETEAVKSSQPTAFTVSSNFQAPPKRVRSPGPAQQPPVQGLALRPDAAFVLLRVAHKDNYLGNLCRKICRLLHKLSESSSSAETTFSVGDLPAGGLPGASFEEAKGASETATAAPMSDYSSIFGEEFRIVEDDGVDISHSGVLDFAAVEEGLLHVIYACATQVGFQPVMSRRLADAKCDLVPVLPLIQAMLPALRPLPSSSSDADHVDETFWQWQAPIVQRAVTQVMALSTSPSYRPLLDACAGFLSSFSPTHEKAACVLIDLCAGPLAPWLPMVVAKVDLAMELLEGLLGIIQAGHGAVYARAALVYLMLALSGHVDDILSQYKDVKHHVLFLMEMLEPFLIPAITQVKSAIAFGDVSAVLLGKQEKSCALALDLLHAAIQKPAVLPAMEAEWRRGQVAPSVLLSILAPHVPQPHGIDLRRHALDRATGFEPITAEDASGPSRLDLLPKSGLFDDEVFNKGDVSTDASLRADVNEDPSLLFAPVELKNVTLPRVTAQFEGTSAPKAEGKPGDVKSSAKERNLVLDLSNADENLNLQAEYLQLVNLQERELRALEFTRFATELHSRGQASKESHQAAIDALLLAAECHLNPFFMIPSSEYQQQLDRFSTVLNLPKSTNLTHSESSIPGGRTDSLEEVFRLEEERDKAVLQILLKAAEWDGKAESDNNPESSFRVHIFNEDSPAEDALTLIREHQELLCGFFVRQLQRERHNMYEVLLQGLLLILDSATQLSSPPGDVIEIILGCAERLNSSLTVYYSEVKEGAVPSVPAGMYGIRRQWTLLCRLVRVASSGRSLEENYGVPVPTGSLLQAGLIPAGAWISKIKQFPFSSSPLVRYVGWMALSQYAKYYEEIGLLLVSDVRQLTNLLVVFADELYVVSGWKLRKPNTDILMEAAHKVAFGSGQRDNSNPKVGPEDNFDSGGLVKVLYPELDLVFPHLRSEFSEFAEIILKSVCQLLRAIPSSSVPDLLTWFTYICSEPFPASVKGYAVANVKYIILYLLEVLVVEHMVAIVPELPRLLRVLVSLCGSSYSDVPLLEAVLAVLKPVISHATAAAASFDEYSQPGVTFEALCFDAMMDQLKDGPSAKEHGSGDSRSALLIFLAGSVLSDLSMTRRIELISSIIQWAKFTVSSSTSMFYNYLRAFQKVLEECNLLLQLIARESKSSFLDGKPSTRNAATQALFALTAPSDLPTRQFGSPPGFESMLDFEESELEHGIVDDDGPGSQEAQDDQASLSDVLTEQTPDDEEVSVDDGTTSLDLEVKRNFFGSGVTIEELKEKCTELVVALSPALEVCWTTHPQLALKLASLAAKCLYYSELQDYYAGNSLLHEERPEQTLDEVVHPQTSNEHSTASHPIEVLAVRVLKLQEAHCWQVASVTMDYLLTLLSPASSSQGLHAVCAVLRYQCRHAPRVSWRLQTGKWLVKALSSTVMNTWGPASSSPLVELLCLMLEHSEPEQRLGALQQLGKLIKDESDCISEVGPDETLSTSSADGLAHVLVASTWDRVTAAAAGDPLLGLRKVAMELLLNFVPLAKAMHLQSFLQSSYKFLASTNTSALINSSGPLTRLALMVLSRSCLFASPTDISMVPANVWARIHFMSNAKTGGVSAEAERAICRALLQLKEQGEEAKEPMKKILSGDLERLPSSSNFGPVREAVLEVLARLSTVLSKEDSKTDAAEELAKEVEEAEVELELASQESISKGDRVEGRWNIPSNLSQVGSGLAHADSKERLRELKRHIMAKEHADMRAAIAARREKQMISRRNRQLALENAASREVELLQELDRERAVEAEREIERQQTLEKERAKTREMRHTLEMEAERRSQRELQRELEQRESGAVRSRRGEFASSTTPSSRPRERYRERDREGGRPVQEGGSSRANAAGGTAGQDTTATPPVTPTAAAISGGASSSAVALSSSTGPTSRTYVSGFAQTARDRDERGGYEDSSAEGNGIARGEAGDGNNFGDGEGGGSGLEGGSSGLASSQRQGGSRTSRPRQVVERRERDGRREGKWERKQT